MECEIKTHLRLIFTHLNGHNFKHGFRDTIDSMSKCGKENETTLHHYLLRCNLHSFHKTELLNDIRATDSSVKNLLKDKLLSTLLYGSEDFNDTNLNTLKSTIKYLVRSYRFM